MKRWNGFELEGVKKKYGRKDKERNWGLDNTFLLFALTFVLFFCFPLLFL